MMTKARQKTTDRNTDAEDDLHDKLTRAKALVHMISTASLGINADPREYHLALEAVWDLLEEAEKARQVVRDVLDNIDWPKPEPAEEKPLDKAMAKAIIQRVKDATKLPKRRGRKPRVVPENGNGDHNGHQLEGGAQ